MASDSTQRDAAEMAALYVAGALSDQENAEFEHRLSAGDSACLAELAALEAVATTLADAAPATPPSDAKTKLFVRIAGETTNGGDDDRQVWKDWTGDSQADLFIQRAGRGRWESTGVDGVEVQRLFVDRPRNQMTMLVRMAAGASYPRHIHDGPEECYVLQGDLRVGDDVLQPGDYQRAAPGSQHGVQSTENGCLLFIVSSLTDEFV